LLYKIYAAHVLELFERDLIDETVALRYVGDHVRARDILVEIGKIALVENGDWLILHRQRPVEVPIG
jgi:hypothetical protein